MAGRLSGKTAIVTGSSSGIGQAIAVRFAAEGARVVVNHRSSAEGAEKTRQQIVDAGGESIVVQGDVSRLEDIQRLMDACWTQLGGCDVLVNNAGIEKGADFWDVTEQDYDTVLDVNLKGPFFLAQAFVLRLREAKRLGRIINISSVHEDMAFPHFSTYCAAKGGLRMLTRNLAVELGPLGITINNIAPGAIATPINTSLMDEKGKLDSLLKNIPLGRLGRPEEVAGISVFLASEEAAYITGSTYVIDGGLMVDYHEQ